MKKMISFVFIIVFIFLSLIVSGCLDDRGETEKVHYIYFDGEGQVYNRNDIVVFDANKFIEDISKHNSL